MFARNTFVKYAGYTDKVLDRAVARTASRNSAKDCSDGHASQATDRNGNELHGKETI
ncbi:hypothetical protein KTQ42_19280 [Noviherbaspirillum sp. L7-7A]|uniref:hypothetical protein n=1 Tax=Noviherbaspirillum sp. L7-7A TaxID=2850560 RepID=UPI001C2BB38E|nr:hypothetical protein [Noviherbaspirillum sp. L7-7A]MBV0881439.1 hypothetical protein [Noviherbaspirillum sp. L7-7A]